MGSPVPQPHLDDELLRVLVVRRDVEPQQDGFAVLGSDLSQRLEQVELPRVPLHVRTQSVGQDGPAELAPPQLLQQRLGVHQLDGSLDEHRVRARFMFVTFYFY